ncbi:MAG: hypothetical protein COZ05_22065, partial [Armatimonadetes bacterium CG_4_10_14_3_um_filter_59_10]
QYLDREGVVAVNVLLDDVVAEFAVELERLDSTVTEGAVGIGAGPPEAHFKLQVVLEAVINGFNLTGKLATR